MYVDSSALSSCWRLTYQYFRFPFPVPILMHICNLVYGTREPPMMAQFGWLANSGYWAKSHDWDLKLWILYIFAMSTYIVTFFHQSITIEILVLILYNLYNLIYYFSNNILLNQPQLSSFRTEKSTFTQNLNGTCATWQKTNKQWLLAILVFYSGRVDTLPAYFGPSESGHTGRPRCTW